MVSEHAIEDLIERNGSQYLSECIQHNPDPGHQAFLGITRPYYRFYRQNTIVPVQSIATSIENGEIPDVVAEKLKRWRDKKLYQFQFVQVAVCCLPKIPPVVTQHFHRYLGQLTVFQQT